MPPAITIDAAARETALPARTIRAWVAAGKLASLPPPPGSRGRRVNLDDVRRIAGQNGRATASGKPAMAFYDPPENVNLTDLPAATADLPDGRLAAILPPALAQLRDEWTLPFVDQIRALAVENGELRATVAAQGAELAELRRQAASSHRDRQEGGILALWWARVRRAAAGMVV